MTLRLSSSGIVSVLGSCICGPQSLPGVGRSGPSEGCVEPVPSLELPQRLKRPSCLCVAPAGCDVRSGEPMLGQPSLSTGLLEHSGMVSLH